MTRYAAVKKLSLSEMAKKIIKLNFTDEYCKGGCDAAPGECPNELLCCMRWLKGEVNT